MATIEIRNLSKAYGSGTRLHDRQAGNSRRRPRAGTHGGVTVLHDLSIQAEQGEFLTLLGPSGCGKTTTLRCLAGLERPDAGSIVMSGHVVADAEQRVFMPPNKRSIGMVFQSYALWPHMTVRANVAYPLRHRRSNPADRHKTVDQILETVGMAAYAERLVTDLSGGQQQRVALARAMVAHPECLLFDEPLSNLDAKLRRSMRREIRAAHDVSGATSVYVTHDQEEAITLSDRIVVLRDGYIQQVGTPRDIYRRPRNRFVADFVGFENIVSAVVTRRAGDGATLSVPGTEGSLRADHAVAAVGDTVDVAIRAEHIQITAASVRDPASDALTGTVLSRTFAGESTEYAIDLGSQRLLARLQESDQASGRDAGPAVGERVDIRVDPAHVVSLHDETRPTEVPATGPA